MKNAIYVPASGGQFEYHWRTWPDFEYNGYDLRYFTNKSMFKCSHLLANAYTNLKIPNSREIYRYPKSATLIGDSGGFQIATSAKKGNTVKISPLDILHWLESNVDIGMNLDIPAWINFEKSLKDSIENFQIFENNRTNYNIKFYNVLHGNNLPQIEQWYDATKDFNFDGWALGIKPPSNVFMQALGFMVLHENNAKDLIDNVHFFGMSSLRNMLALSMIAKHFDCNITFDSSSFNMGSRTRMYYLPTSTRNSISFGRDTKPLIQKLPCHCPVCRVSNIRDMYDQTNGTLPGILICLHNLYQYVERNRLINIMSDDYNVLLEYAKSVDQENTVSVMQEVLNSYDKIGYKKTYNEYKKRNIFLEKYKIPTEKNLASYPCTQKV